MTKPKKTAWHKKRGRIIPSKYAKVHHGKPETDGRDKKDKTDTPTKRFMRHVADVAKKAAKE